MGNDLERFGKKDAKWLKENGFQMVPRGWVASEKDADFHYWTVRRKLSEHLEVRLQFDCEEDAWSGWPIFPEALVQFLDLENTLVSKDWPDAETAFKRTMEGVKLLLDAAAEVKKSLGEESGKEN